VLSDADLSAMRAFHEAHGSRTTILLRSVAEPRQYGLVETDADGRLRRFREKPGPDEPIATNTINAGVYLIDAALLARIPARQVVSVEREFFPALIAEGVPCYGFTTEAYWRDIGSPAAYRAAQVDLLAGQVKTPLAPPGELRDGCWIEPSAFVATGARLEAPAVIGAEAAVQVGARVGPSTVSASARASRRARASKAPCSGSASRSGRARAARLRRRRRRPHRGRRGHRPRRGARIRRRGARPHAPGRRPPLTPLLVFGDARMTRSRVLD